MHTYPSRYGTLTEKGQLLKMEKLEYEFNLCLNKLRKQCNRLRILNTDKTDLEVIKFEIGILEDLMDDLRHVFNLIVVNDDSCEDFHNFHKECSERLDLFEMEHHSLIKTVCDNISEKEQEPWEMNTRLYTGSQHSSLVPVVNLVLVIILVPVVIFILVVTLVDVLVIQVNRLIAQLRP